MEQAIEFIIWLIMYLPTWVSECPYLADMMDKDLLKNIVVACELIGSMLVMFGGYKGYKIYKGCSSCEKESLDTKK